MQGGAAARAIAKAYLMPGSSKHASKKEKIKTLARNGDYDEITRLSRSDAGVARALASYLYSDDELLFWRSVKAFGRLAAENPESVRRFVTRLLWQLNDESGSIGRGSAQVIGEMAAHNMELVKNAVPVVVHYLEDYGMLPGVLYAIGRIGSVRPDITRDIELELAAFLEDESPTVRGMAAWALGEMGAGAERVKASLQTLLDDEADLTIYDPAGDTLKNAKVKELARRALEDR